MCILSDSIPWIYFCAYVHKWHFLFFPSFFLSNTLVWIDLVYFYGGRGSCSILQTGLNLVIHLPQAPDILRLQVHLTMASSGLALLHGTLKAILQEGLSRSDPTQTL